MRTESPEIMGRFPLIEAGLQKEDCFAALQAAGIELPVMYRLGFDNNNCIGCPKGGNAYWNLIRKHFPEYSSVCVQSRGSLVCARSS